MSTDAMQAWTFPAVFTEHGPGDVGVSFPDVPEALTGGDTLAEARAQAPDALDVAILGRLAHGDPIPAPRAAKEGEELVVLDPVTAARAALSQAMAAQRLSSDALARRLGKSERAVKRLTNGASGVKLDAVLRALAEVGRRGAFATV